VSIHSAEEDQIVIAWMQAEVNSDYPWIGLSTQTCSYGCGGNWAAEYTWSDGTAIDYSNPSFSKNDPAPTYGHHYKSGGRWGTWCPTCVSEGICQRWPMLSPPPLSPLPPSPPALVLSSTGPCVMEGNCVCSSNYPGGTCSATSAAEGSYSSNEACHVAFVGSVVLQVHLFDTESGYDKMTVGGIQYQGTAGPDGVSASSLSFESDGSVQRSGFKICFAPPIIAYWGGSDHCDSLNRCSIGQGDCDSDTDCQDGLLCFQRTYGEAVPGVVTAGSNVYDVTDICYNPSSD